MWVNEGTPTMSFVLYTINEEYTCDASYATWKYRQYIDIFFSVHFDCSFTESEKKIENIFCVVAKLFLTGHLYCFNDKKIYARNTRTYNLLEVKQKMRFHYYWIWPPVYLHFAKFCISTRKLHDIFCIVFTFMLHNLHCTYIPH